MENNNLDTLLAESPFAQLGTILDSFWNTVITFFQDYLFGILALIIWIRVIVTIFNGRTSAMLIALAILFTLIAVAQGQNLW